MQNKIFFSLISSLILVSCGGGGGGSSDGGGYGGGGSTTNTAPTFVNLTNYDIDENTTAVTTVQATDAQGDTISYSISGTDSGYLSIGTSSGVLAFNQPPDYENPTDSNTNNDYEILVVASDGQASTSSLITINVEDVNEGPTITSSSSYSVVENNTTIGEVTTSTNATFSLSGADSNLITIGSTSGILEFKNAPDYENPQDAGGDNDYNITVTASDSNGSSSLDITITVTDGDDSAVNADNLFISEYAEGSSYNKYIEIYNGTAADVNLNDYKIRTTVRSSSNREGTVYWNDYFPAGAQLTKGDVYVVCDQSANEDIKSKCDAEAQYFFNGDDTWELVTDYTSETSYTVIDVIGDNTDPGSSGWTVCGTSGGTKEHTLIKKDGIEGNTSWSDSVGASSEDCDWIVKEQNDFNDLGVHTWNGSSSGGGTGGGGGGGGGTGGTGGTIPDGSPELYISEYADVDSQSGAGQYGNTKYIEIYNPYNEAVDLSAYTLKGISNAAGQSNTWGSSQTGSGRVYELSGTIAAKDVYLITGVDSAQYGDIDDGIVSQADKQLEYESPVHFNGDDAVGLFKGDALLDLVGQPEPVDIGVGWEVCGVENGTRSHTLIKKADKVGSSDWPTSAGTNADDCHWIVEDEGYFSNAGFHNQQLMIVTIPNGISGGLFINSQQKPALTLTRGETYRFDTSASSNSSHPIIFGDATEVSSSSVNYGTQYGAPGTANSYFLLEVTDEIPSNFYYFCANHSGMGSSVTITDAANSAPELVMPTNVYTEPSNYVYVDEGQTSVATFTANDSDEDDLNFFVSGTDANSFNINNGVLAFKSAPSYAQKREYEVIVNVNDGAALDSETISIFVDEVCNDTLIGYKVCLGEESNGGLNYNRESMYPTWDDWDNDCQSNRHEVLIDESTTAVSYTSSTNCSVATGRWYDPYDNKFFTSASEVQIDHFVPLSEAHSSGSWRWSSLRKRIFANTLNVPEQLIAVGGDSNSSKGSSDPSEWLPNNSSYHCEYIDSWVKIKSIFRLDIDTSEKNAIESNYSGCDNTAQTITIDVSVEPNSNGSGNVYVIDGVQKKSLNLEAGNKYIFNHSSNHPLRFSTTSDGTHGGGAEYVTGVEKSNGVTTINVTSNTPDLYYYCSVHPGMGADTTTVVGTD